MIVSGLHPTKNSDNQLQEIVWGSLTSENVDEDSMVRRPNAPSSTFQRKMMKRNPAFPNVKLFNANK